MVKDTSIVTRHASLLFCGIDCLHADYCIQTNNMLDRVSMKEIKLGDYYKTD